MTLVIDAGRDGPRVHLLAIGVGAYRHLPGGADPVPHDTFGLRQLTGPPHAAMAFTDFVVSGLNHPGARLGTVEVLLSPPAEHVDPVEGEIRVGVPNLANTIAAFEAWYERCDSHEGNVALFYFCGHGVQKESPYLLLEDFGQSRLAMMRNSVDIMATYTGMAACQARSQYFFVDACREIPQQFLENLGGAGHVLKDPEVVSDDRDGALLFGASGGHKAYGRPGQATRFTEALIRSLEGLGARPDNGRWVVDFPGLQRAVTTVLRLGDPAAPVQRPQSFGAVGDGIVQVCAQPPYVPLRVSCWPPEAVGRPGTTVLLESLSQAAEPVTPTARDGGWDADVRADMYRLAVQAGPPYRGAVAQVGAWPPWATAEVSVAP
ncbi:caspase family protein [Jidongwangia harbinensis]|uniref:caspase family protein n=1 Tax=Jidongwangia harbinensis TaxID=2878561 RepID=UPI001CD9BC76|nr:caspase family protein [Jidongwangia harbinensis]MCA2218034.1 caspase family protein [Jidongwangia harbinensis]